MYYICWKNPLTGETGKGSEKVPLEEAKRWLEFLRRGAACYDYWLEKVN